MPDDGGDATIAVHIFLECRPNPDGRIQSFSVAGPEIGLKTLQLQLTVA